MDRLTVLMPATNYTLLIILLLVFLSGCDNIVDFSKSPKDRISSDLVFKDKQVTEANLAQIYENTHFLYRNPNQPVMDIFLAGMAASARGFAYWQPSAAFPLEIIDASGAGVIDYWPYWNIRSANEFINGIKNSDYNEEYISQKVAEVRYLRAHEYFELVKRYGGVPIVTEPQSFEDPEDELFLERNSEQEVYDFIANEIDDIASILPPSKDEGRVDKYTALSLKSRAMLYAASVAEFGEVKMDGLLGIPSSEADKYWQSSYDASRAIIESGRFALYNELPNNPSQNFQDLFVEEEGNPERIFVKQYDADKNKGHSWDLGAVPFEFRQTWGSNFCAFLNAVELFEYKDGSSGKIERDLIKGDHLFDIDNVFRDRDPRFLATFFFPESEWQDGKVHFHRRTVIDGEEVSSGTVGDGWPASAPRRNWVNTGFLVRKMMDESQIGPLRETSSQDWMVYRYAETLLNSAEAAFYLGKQSEALEHINKIRNRAGMPELNSITEEDVRHERMVELLFENHRYWDLRRWRIAGEFLDGLRTKGLEYTYHYEERKYDFHLKNGDPESRVFQERHYYLPLGVDRVSGKSNMVENPGY